MLIDKKNIIFSFAINGKPVIFNEYYNNCIHWVNL